MTISLDAFPNTQAVATSYESATEYQAQEEEITVEDQGVEESLFVD